MSSPVSRRKEPKLVSIGLDDLQAPLDFVRWKVGGIIADTKLQPNL